MRTNRDFKLTATIRSAGQEIEIEPPFRVSFSIDKSIYGGLNKAKIKIYNLSLSKRELLAKDAEEATVIPVSFSVGYQERLELIFKGRVHIGRSEREGSDIVTTLESLDGMQATTGFTSRTIDGGDVLKAIINDAGDIQIGKITDLQKLIRPRVLLGNTIDLLNEQIDRGSSTWFIDDEKLNVIKSGEITSNFLPVVEPETGLLSTPTRENRRVTFVTLMNPAVKIGGACELLSSTAPYLNGTYKNETINYTGDNYGSTWQQTVTGTLIAGYEAL